MIKYVKYILFSVVLSSCFLLSKNSDAQASWEKFGQNQMQYQNFQWKYYDSTHFRVFFYRPADKLADHVLNQAENELSSIVQKMGGSLPRKLNIILYNSYSDYIQTNIGVNHTSDLNDADGGRLKVSGDNLPVYFTGNHADLMKQVKRGVANVIKEKMLFNNLREYVKNAIRMNLPEWYTTGYVQHISEDWTPELETEVQNIISLTDSNTKFRTIAQKNPKIIGHSFWRFIEKQYGPNAISNLLYLSRFKKNVDVALKQVVKKDAALLYDEWKTFYAIDEDLLADDNTFGRVLKTDLKSKFEGRYSQFYLSPNGTQLAYVQRREGEWKIIIQETDLGDSKVLAQGGYKNLDEIHDPNYPLIAWSPSGNNLVTIYPSKDQTFVRLYNTTTQRKQNKLLSRRKIERITGVCFTNNDYTLILSGIKKGKSDIFSYNFRRNRITNLTNDDFDDHSPSYVSSGNKVGVLFLSNRQDTVMNQEELKSKKYFHKDFNIYYFNQKNRATLRKVTNTSSPISSPIQYGLDKFSYIEKQDGKLVRKIIEVDNTATGAVSFKVGSTQALPFNVLKHHYIPNQESVVEVIKKKGQYYIYNTQVKDLEKYDAENKTESVEATKEDKIVQSKKTSAPYETAYENVDTNSALYNMFTKGEYAVSNSKEQSNLVNIPKRRKKKRYTTTFNPKVLSTSLDNTLLFTRYQNIAYNQGGFQFPSVNGFLSFELIDILEDQKITGGIRIPTTFDGTSYFLQYANYKKRLDWKMTYFHQQTTQEYDASEAPDSLFSPTNFLGKVGTDYFETNVRYPFNRANSVNLSIGFRYDRVRYLANNQSTIKFPNQREYWSFMRGEYIFDNSINPLLNIRKGTRAKLFAEYQYRLSSPSTGFYQIGFDVRNYTTIYKNTILASRIATGLSDGSAKLLYYLGGVDNTLIQTPGEDRGPIPTNINEYAFQTLATNLRGYRQQAFNGSSYAIINEEIRLPIYNTFFNRPIKSAFLRNLQLVTFVDLGVAWRGILPIEENTNPSFKDTNASGNVVAEFNNDQDIMGLGYGVGVRTKLMGYFIRFDVGWNIEQVVGNRRPQYHLSMATDF